MSTIRIPSTSAPAHRPSIPAEHQELWNSIRVFDIDASRADLSFAARLARENAWSRAFAERVITEYKRFVFLAMAAGHPVTPSDQVDQAWHLHLTYTRSYWERLRAILPAPLHHEPTRGGPREDHKFDDWYSRTLHSYQRFFGPPPADIWPDSHTRFHEDVHFARVHTRRNFIIPRDRARRAFFAGAAIVTPLAVLVGCSSAFRAEQGAAILLFPIILVVAFIVLASILTQSRAGSTPRRTHTPRRHDSAGAWFPPADPGFHSDASSPPTPHHPHAHSHGHGHAHGDAHSHSHGHSHDLGGSDSSSGHHGCGSGGSDAGSGCASSGCGSSGCGGGGSGD